MTVLRRHDRHVLALFWSSFGGVVLFFTVVSVVLDLCERLARFIKNWGGLTASGYQPGWLILEFYASYVPFIWLRLVPVCVPIAAAITLARLSRRNELVPLVTSGISTRRIVLPIVVSGLVVAVMLVGLREAAAPRLGRVQLTLGRLLTKGDPERIKKVPHFQDPGGARLSADAYLPLVPGLEGAMITLRDAEGRPDELQWYPRLEWSESRRRWVATRGGARYPLQAERSGERLPILPDTAAPLEAGVTLLEVSITDRAALALSLEESATLLRAAPDDPRVIGMHQDQWTLPLAAFVLLLVALPFGMRLADRGAWPGLVAALAAGASFYAFHFLVRGLGGSGEVNPVVVAWVPTIAFASLGMALVLTMDS